MTPARDPEPNPGAELVFRPSHGRIALSDRHVTAETDVDARQTRPDVSRAPYAAPELVEHGRIEPGMAASTFEKKIE